MTIVFVSHDLAMVRTLCDRVMVLDNGKIYRDGKVDEGLQAYCEKLGVSLEDVLTCPSIDHPQLQKMERRWIRRNVSGT